MNRGEGGGLKTRSKVDGINAEEGVLFNLQKKLCHRKKATRSRTNSTFSQYRRLAILSEKS